MAEQFLTLMADLDDDSQAIMAGWYEALTKAGFDGQQTHGLPFHISLATYPLEREAEAISLARKLGEHWHEIPFYISHIGVFPGGRVLFGAPDMSPELLALHDASEEIASTQEYVWTPHATIMIDEPDIVARALPVLAGSFVPFYGKIVRLLLCAFWPTREIVTVELVK